jgi:hypothetical protein
MSKWLDRWKDAPMPYQDWRPFPPTAIVQVKNKSGDSRIGLAREFWGDYETEMGEPGDGVVIKIRRLDRLKDAKE